MTSEFTVESENGSIVAVIPPCLIPFVTTAKTSSADHCDFFLLSHRTESKQENDATEPVAPGEKAFNR